MSIARRIAALLVSACAAACAVGPNFERPNAPQLSGYAMQGDADASATVRLAPSAGAPENWWNSFGSSELNVLVNEALANNQTLAEANANLDAARSQAAAASGGRLPQVNATAAAVRERINTASFGFTGFPSPTISLYSVGPSVSFDFDVFGGRRRAVERQEARATAQQARVDAAYLSISGNVVQTAVLVAGLRAKLATQEEIVAGDQRILDMVGRAIEAGGQPPAAAHTVEAQLAEDQADTPSLRQQLAVARHHMALLVGRAPAQWSAPELDLGHFTAPAAVPVSLPSDLVRRRPDILAAEAELHAATANIGVETAALYPNLSLNAYWLQSAIDPSDIFESTAAGWSIGPGITAPIFHGGALRANVRTANAEQRAALAVYQQTVLEAFVQVADVIQGVGNAQDTVAIQQRAVAAADANTRSAQLAYENGAGTLLSLVDAQRQSNRVRQGLVDAQIDLYQAVAALYVATASDWRQHAQ